jgi:hypothetical protein
MRCAQGSAWDDLHLDVDLLVFASMVDFITVDPRTMIVGTELLVASRGGIIYVC